MEAITQNQTEQDDSRGSRWYGINGIGSIKTRARLDIKTVLHSFILFLIK